MDHAEARERLELAAVEPGGLERLMAGDTPDSAAVAGHLAGCVACQEELRRLHAAAALIRDTVRSTAPADLRDRTLGYVSSLGREPAGETTTASAPTVGTPRRGRAPARWIAAIAAALVVAVVGTALVVGAQRDAAIAERDALLARRAEDVAALEKVTAASLRVASSPDARTVALEGTGSGGVRPPSGSLAFSPGSRELVVIATGLPSPGEGREFRCWVESGGDRRPVGRMYFAEDVAFWVGEVDAVGSLGPDSTFGVSLVDSTGEARNSAPALLGEL